MGMSHVGRDSIFGDMKAPFTSKIFLKRYVVPPKASIFIPIPVKNSSVLRDNANAEKIRATTAPEITANNMPIAQL